MQGANWFVAWHKDLAISGEKKIELPGFGHWTIKQDQYAVQPPVSILDLKGVYKRVTEESANEEEICRVKAGSILIMRPLLQHASNRTTSGRRRRIIHIEFSNVKLPMGLEWAEQIGKGIWPEAQSFVFSK